MKPLKTLETEKPEKDHQGQKRIERGRIYWNPDCVRVWMPDGRMIDFGWRSLESAKVVAREFNFELHVRRW